MTSSAKSQEAEPTLAQCIESLRGLAGVIRQYGTCAPMAIETVAHRIERIVAAPTHPPTEPVAGAGAPSEDMIERGRTAVMALDCTGPKWTVRQHYDAAGLDPTGIPAYLLDMRPPLPKANRAELVWYAMTAAPADGGSNG